MPACRRHARCRAVGLCEAHVLRVTVPVISIHHDWQRRRGHDICCGGMPLGEMHQINVGHAMAAGAMQMNGINSLITVAKYWKEWSDPRMITLVLNNRDLNMVTWEQCVLTGDAKYQASQDLPDFPYAAYAESLGLKGIRVADPDKVGTAWDEALHADRPVVFEAVTDPNVRLLPLHITLEQAPNMTAALAKGDVDAPGVIRQTVKSMIDAVTH